MPIANKFNKLIYDCVNDAHRVSNIVTTAYLIARPYSIDSIVKQYTVK